MRTTVTIETDRMDELKKWTKSKSKRAAVIKAIDEQIRRAKISRLCELAGKIEFDETTMTDSDAAAIEREKLFMNMSESTELVMVDTSVWIDFFRGRTPEINDLLKRLLTEDRVARCGAITAELRLGLKPKEKTLVLDLMDALHSIGTTDPDWDLAGDMANNLKMRGITVPLMDALIAAVCIHHKIHLLTLDGLFVHFDKLQMMGIDLKKAAE